MKQIIISAVFGLVGIFTIATTSIAAPQTIQISPDLVAFPISR
ncbi:MAG: hypothetical protein ACJZ9G_06700 [Rhodospirillales bacterium]